jgi:hypothetical protein
LSRDEKPAEMPVQQAVKIELVINLQTTRSLGLTIPLPLLGRALRSCDVTHADARENEHHEISHQAYSLCSQV